MADFGEKSAKRKKRKVGKSGEKQRVKKSRASDEESKVEAVDMVGVEALEKMEEGRQWRNLQLVMSLQKRNIEIEKKVELAFDFVKSMERGDDNGDFDESTEAVSMPRLLVFLNDWVQTVLIAKGKSGGVNKERIQNEENAMCLDFRCWEVFRFCLKQALMHQVSLSFSRSLLRAFVCVSESAVGLLDKMSDSEDLVSGEEFEGYTVVLDCLSMVLLKSSRMLTENLDMWISAVEVVLQLVLKVFSDHKVSQEACDFVVKFSFLVLDYFSKYLRVHPCRKNGFQDFVNKLLDPLLHVCGILHPQGIAGNIEWAGNLSKFVDEVLTQGLFHKVHLDGVLNFRRTEQFLSPRDGKEKDQNIYFKSYHRHLFGKLEEIFAEKKTSSFAGISQLLRLLILRVKSQKPAASAPKDAPMTATNEKPKNDEIISSNDSSSSSSSMETWKSLFDVFAQTLEPALHEIYAFLQSEIQVGPRLLEIDGVLKCGNSLLSELMQEEVYSKVEETSKAACFDYLKKVYDVIESFAIKVTQLWLVAYSKGKRKHVKILTSISEELILAMGKLYKIDSEVVGDDLVSLWLRMFSFFSFGSVIDERDSFSLHSRVLSFGCQLLNSREVSNVVVSMCKAMRSLGPPSCSNKKIDSLTCKLYAGSIRKLIGSPDFRSALCNAVKAIASREGKAAVLIDQLTKDVSDSLKWIKGHCSAAAREDSEQLDSKDFRIEYTGLQLEIFGSGLSETYTLVFDSVPVTANSNLVGTSLEKLMTVLRRCMKIIVAEQPNSLDEFLLLFTKKKQNNKNITHEFLLRNLRESAHNIFLFFFRLYLSFRSLYRQAICLLDPKISKKLSKHVGDSVSAYSGRELLGLNEYTDGGYFSWITQPSASLVTIINFHQQDLFRDGPTVCPALFYVFHVMAIQRLVDINWQLKTFEYLQRRTDCIVHSNVTGEADLSFNGESSYETRIPVLRQEAMELVDFMLGQLSLITAEHKPSPTSIIEAIKDTVSEVSPSRAWDLVVCSLSERSLPAAIWRILCQNIDIWCIHAAKKQLKAFLTLLIQTSHPQNYEPSPKQITIRKVSLELLGNTVLYEQKSLRRHLASRFCSILKMSMLSLPNASANGNHDFSSSAWTGFLASLDKSLEIALCRNDVSSEISLLGEEKFEILICQGILNLLCWIPIGYFDQKYFTCLATIVLNIERLVLSNILETGGREGKWLGLLITCRRALKYVVLSAGENVEATSPFILMAPDNSVATLWLLKSVSTILQLPNAFSEVDGSRMRDYIFSLVDHTSNVFLNLSKNQFYHILLTIESQSEKGPFVDVTPKLGHCVNVGDTDAWRSLVSMAKTLKEETAKLSFSAMNGSHDYKAASGFCGVDSRLNKISCHLSCIQGFMWGLACALTTKNCSIRPEVFKLEKEVRSKVSTLSSMFTDILNMSRQFFQFRHSQWPGIIFPTELEKQNGPSESTACQQQTSVASSSAVTCDMHSDYDMVDSLQKPMSLGDTSHGTEIPIDVFELQHLNKSCLQSLLRNDHPEAAFLLRQLCLAASAVNRLNIHIDQLPLPSISDHHLTAMSQVLLLELADMVEAPPPFSFVWLDGVLKYLEELGNNFLITKSTPMINHLYNKLIDLHLRVNGKCICLLGKGANLASHETESSTKMLDSDTVLPRTLLPLKPSSLDDFKSRLRTSFIGIISKASEQHLLSAIQVIERSLIGVQEGSTMIYEIVTGGATGGHVSSIVAAGVDCLDLVLEHASGRKRLGVIQRHIQKLVADLFNIVWHLQSPHMFVKISNVEDGRSCLDPDPGAVTLMCTEVLIKILAKQALFRLDKCHVVQALRLPGALFQNFLHINHSLGHSTSDIPMASETGQFEPMLGSLSSVVDKRFSIDLYAASCRLLSTVIKHHKNDCDQSIGVLQDSVSVLLNCLETVNSVSGTKHGNFSWQEPEVVRCACSLRRVYEELRQQKDVFGNQIHLFLSHYVSVLSLCGPRKSGIKREVHNALKPGIYALIDACSEDNLNYLHIVFGEGSCRNKLIELREAYLKEFRYDGKV